MTKNGIVKMGMFLWILGIVLPQGTRSQVKETVDYVNPFVGTEKSSHLTVWEARGATFPGVLLPFGMVQITPDGYMYSDKRIKAFSFLNHNSGWSSHGSFRLMAFTGDVPEDGSAFRHQQERATPYYYRVNLEDYGINAEFTATGHAALCRFKFPQSSSAHFVFSDVSEVKAVGNDRIRGRCGSYFFIATFSKGFQSAGVSVQPSASAPVQKPSGYYIDFSTASGEMILVQIGFSMTSIEGAENNLHTEIPDWNFDDLVLKSKKTWNDQLDKIEIKTTDEKQKEIFYTALYHSLFMPAVLSDAGSPNKKYTGLYPWDTYRSEHPLITILDPEREGDMISSELAGYDRTGWLPTGNMMGNHNTQLILDGFVKGVTNFDVSKACGAMVKSMLDSPYARREMADFVRYGYVPAAVTSSVTHSLEFAYDNWAAAVFLEKTGNKEKYGSAYQTLMDRARNYANSYDPATGFMRARTADGQWTDGGYAEGTEWTYSWYTPHDVQGLINLMGGKKMFSDKLNTCFDKGHYVHDNEPPLHYAYLFDFCGEPWKTQEWARKITEGSYSADPGGIPGNDDLGAMSSWFVFSAMGFYPVTPGTAQYEIGSPLFEKTSIHLSNGKQFNIIANHVSKENKYIQSATLNGKPFNQSWFSHADILAGKTLVFEMGPKPNKVWATSQGSAPYSMTSGTPHFSWRKAETDKTVFKANDTLDFSVWVQNDSRVQGMVQLPVLLDGRPYQTISAVVNAGENKRLHTRITLYEQGKHGLSVTGLQPLKVEVLKTAPEFKYSHLEIPMPPLVKTGDSINIQARVKNTGSYIDSTRADLIIDGKVHQSKQIVLKPGEERNIRFVYVPKRESVCSIAIGDLKPALLRIQGPADKPHHNDSLFSALNARLVLDFDEGETATIRDWSGKNNNGQVKGKLKWVPGIYGQAIQTNASTGDYIALPDSITSNDPGQELTLMAWVYPEEEKNFSDIISKGEWNSLQLKGSNQLINFYADGWEGHEAMAPVPENWNRHWHHLAGVSDGTDYKLYVDGKLVVTKKGEKRNPRGETGTANYSGSPWAIGRNANSPERVFNGCIDEVMIFQKALNQEQIVNLMLHIY